MAVCYAAVYNLRHLLEIIFGLSLKVISIYTVNWCNTCSKIDGVDALVNFTSDAGATLEFTPTNADSTCEVAAGVTKQDFETLSKHLVALNIRIKKVGAFFRCRKYPSNLHFWKF